MAAGVSRVRDAWLPAAMAASVGVLGYLLAAHFTLRLGFPLDDAWIHQVYARNLGLHGEWSFFRGEPSAGSTSPLWVAYLALGYLLRVRPLVWAFLAGGLVLVATGSLGARWIAHRLPERGRLAWTAALLVALEWHLVWAALSGMETLSLGALALACFYLAERERVPAIWLGGLVGVGIWLRPEAVLLLVVPVGRAVLKRSPVYLTGLVAGLSIPAAGYLWFQRTLAGSWWPNTFFAKQAEYASLRAIPWPTRLLTQAGVPGEWLGAPGLEPGGPMVGMLAVLAPGLLVNVVLRIRERNWMSLLPLGWVAIHLVSYAFRLPVTYQHGRYAIPTVPVLVVLSLEGMLAWLDFSDRRRLQWTVSRAWALVLAVVTAIFWAAGAQAYARDVAIIESEMVGTARWVERNTDPTAVVAAHDIGALGYFADRALLDMAGLVSPEVVPFIRDQTALSRYLDRNRADYLVTFPGWYPQLVRGRQPLYQGSARFSPDAGGENMAVYRWSASSFAPCIPCAILAANLAQEG